METLPEVVPSISGSDYGGKDAETAIIDGDKTEGQRTMHSDVICRETEAETPSIDRDDYTDERTVCGGV